MTIQTPVVAAAPIEKMDIVKYVTNDIEKLTKEQGLVLPPDYEVGNAIQSAFLMLQTIKDKEGKGALTTCDKSSIVYALRNMIVQGLNVDKKQGYFIVYGNQLTFQRSYFGTIAVAKRFASVKGEPIAQIILKGDKVATAIINGEERIVSHERVRNFEKTITAADIVGAYCIVNLRNGEQRWEIMDMGQIQAAWNKSKSQQAVHKEFPDQMAKKTIIARALKMVINSSDDAPLVVKAFNESGYVAEEDNEAPTLTIPETAFATTISPSDAKGPDTTPTVDPF